MRRTRAILSIGTAALMLICLFGRSAVVVAAEANAPSLIISQLKITSSNGQFITLYNASDQPVDMSRYQLEYFNSYDLSKATSSRLIALSGTVPPHGYYMVNDSSLLLCYQLTVDSVSLGLSSTAGLVEVLAFNQSAPGGSVVPGLQDFVGWSKSAASGAQTLPTDTDAFLQRQPSDSHGNPVIMAAGSGSWQAVQPDATNPCNLVTNSVTPATVASGLSQLLPASAPPATIISTSDEGVADQPPVGLPANDIGLMAPQITELLPNPNGTGNDASDEYIELYNPNATDFDLSGFVLQTGLTSLHTYHFPSGSTIPPHAFVAYSSETTGLTLSNTSSQAKLLDPLSNSISSSASYTSAKDGQAWALAQGKWYWTTSPTPGAANVIKQPAAKKKAATSKTATAKTATKAKTTKSKTTKPTLSRAAAAEAGVVPVHVWTLALVIGLALLYGAYEYRADLANYFHQLRGYLGPGRSNR